MITDLPAGPGYDLIILNHVLEHLLDPVETLKRLRACANEGAYLYASSPNLGRLADHRKMSYVTNGVHVMSFTDASMTAVLGLAGWRSRPAFDGGEWDQLSAKPGMRLRIVATAARSAAPQGEPLAAADLALRGFAARERGTKHLVA